MIECSGLNAAWLKAVDFMQHGPKHPNWMQWITCSMAQIIPIECSGLHAAWLNAVDTMHREKWNHIECSGLYAAWLNAVDSMQHVWKQWILCSITQCIPIEISGFYAAWPKSSRLNVWIPFIVIEFSVIHAAWSNASRLNAVDSMQRDWMEGRRCGVERRSRRERSR